MKKGLVLEGGAMRGMYTCGIMDVMMEAGIVPDGIVGVSAGAAFGCNYKSGQAGRALRYNLRFAGDRRYSGVWSLLTTGDYYNAKFAYHIVPTQYDIFDAEAFASSPIEFTLVCTDVLTGKPVYHQCTEADYDCLEWIRASSSLPLVARIVNVGGYKLLDGGISDSVPLQYFQNLGYGKNVVILTRPEGYVKGPSSITHLVRIMYRRYPNLVNAVAHRHEMYNAQLEYVAQEEAAGRAFVFRPNPPLEIGHVCDDCDVLQRTYDQGRQHALSRLDALIHFIHN
ncbi:MAG: patatin family protein [Muribaculaceae bacterium]|nr:patatin family protein [Muribaculaceae bacterium]